MSEQFMMDSHTYHYTHDNDIEGFENFERIVVTDVNGDYVGELEVLHNSECANIRLDNGDVDGVSYYEAIEHSHEHLARWVVARTY